MPRERILVRTPNWLGDLVMATPGLRALRCGRPDAEIVAHVRPEWLPLLAGAPWVDELLPLESYHRGVVAMLREASRLRRRRFDLGLCLPDSFSSALLMRLAGVGEVVGYATPGRSALLDRALPPPRAIGGRRFVPREQHVLGLVEAVGCPAAGSHLELFVTPEEERELAMLAGREDLRLDGPVVLVAPGASYGVSKLWPPERFARVGDALAEEGATVLVIGSRAEAGLAQAVVDAMRRPARSLAGRLGLGALKALIRRSRLLVCNDAGARHVAVALGVPCVVLFGPTSLAKTSWNLERVRPLAADVGCRPCYLRRCPIDHRCMRRLPVEIVVEAARELWHAAPAARPGAARLRLVPGERGSEA